MLFKSNLLKAIGPGIIFACTAIGVSHLVQSTQAGANYGFLLLWAVILANIFKYPFFEFGSRYANVTGKSLIDGYQIRGHLDALAVFRNHHWFHVFCDGRCRDNHRRISG